MIQVFSGALALYLVVGLLFASVIAFVATVDKRDPYFTQGNKAQMVSASTTRLRS